jgi:hypothetical protein
VTKYDFQQIPVVLPENAYRLISLIFFGEVVNLELPVILDAEGKSEA